MKMDMVCISSVAVFLGVVAAQRASTGSRSYRQVFGDGLLRRYLLPRTTLPPQNTQKLFKRFTGGQIYPQHPVPDRTYSALAYLPPQTSSLNLLDYLPSLNIGNTRLAYSLGYPGSSRPQTSHYVGELPQVLVVPISNHLYDGTSVTTPTSYSSIDPIPSTNTNGNGVQPLTTSHPQTTPRQESSNTSISRAELLNTIDEIISLINNQHQDSKSELTTSSLGYVSSTSQPPLGSDSNHDFNCSFSSQVSQDSSQQLTTTSTLRTISSYSLQPTQQVPSTPHTSKSPVVSQSQPISKEEGFDALISQFKQLSLSFFSGLLNKISGQPPTDFNSTPPMSTTQIPKALSQKRHPSFVGQTSNRALPVVRVEQFNSRHPNPQRAYSTGRVPSASNQGPHVHYGKGQIPRPTRSGQEYYSIPDVGENAIDFDSGQGVYITSINSRAASPPDRGHIRYSSGGGGQQSYSSPNNKLVSNYSTSGRLVGSSVFGQTPPYFNIGALKIPGIPNIDPLKSEAQSFVHNYSNGDNSVYFFSYMVADPVHGTYLRYQELRRGDLVNGFYIIIHPDTHSDVTAYEADAGGSEKSTSNRMYNRDINSAPSDA